MFPGVRMYVFFGVEFVVVPVLGRQPRRLARVSLPCVLRPAFHSPPSHRRAPASPLPRRRAVNADKRYPRTRSLPHFCFSRNLSIIRFTQFYYAKPYGMVGAAQDTKNVITRVEKIFWPVRLETGCFMKAYCWTLEIPRNAAAFRGMVHCARCQKEKKKGGGRSSDYETFSSAALLFSLSRPAAVRTIPFGRHAESESPRIPEPHCPNEKGSCWLAKRNLQPARAGNWRHTPPTEDGIP